MKETKTWKKNLTIVWVGYKKAYDFVPHTCQEIYNILHIIETFSRTNMMQYSMCWMG